MESKRRIEGVAGFLYNLAVDKEGLLAEKVRNKYPIAGRLPDQLIERLVLHVPPRHRMFHRGYAKGIGIGDSHDACMLYNSLPHTSRQIGDMRPIGHIVEHALALADKGATIIGLGAATKSTRVNSGLDVQRRLRLEGVRATHGNGNTVYISLETGLDLAGEIRLCLSEISVCVIGATGSTGSALARLAAKHFKEVRICGGDYERLEKLAKSIGKSTCTPCTSIQAGVTGARIIFAVSGNTSAIELNASWLNRDGTIVIDVARPRNIKIVVSETLPEGMELPPYVFLTEGSYVRIPQLTHFGIVCEDAEYLMPKDHEGNRWAPPCNAEPLILLPETDFKVVSIGPDLDPDLVLHIGKLGKDRGFTRGPLRLNEQVQNPEDFNAFKDYVLSRREAWV